jgi:membrane-associated phospholipid phosphatase
MSTVPYPAPSPAGGTVRLPSISRSAWIQIGIFLLAYLLYSMARFVTIGDLSDAVANAHWIVDFERSLDIDIEGPVQTALSGTWAIWILNHVYLAAQLVVLPGSLLFLYRRSRPVYEKLRNTVLATWLISIPVYALFPCAPPRLAHIGMVDTITQQTGFAMDSKLTTSFYNQLAAVPSLHVGFAFAIGVAIAAASSNRLVKLVAYLWGPTVALAVVATGNHFVFDILAGMLAAAAGWAIGMLIIRLSNLRPAFIPAAA